jgi:hypothetical protein
LPYVATAHPLYVHFFVFSSSFLYHICVRLIIRIGGYSVLLVACSSWSESLTIVSPVGDHLVVWPTKPVHPVTWSSHAAANPQLCLYVSMSRILPMVSVEDFYDSVERDSSAPVSKKTSFCYFDSALNKLCIRKPVEDT